MKSTVRAVVSLATCSCLSAACGDQVPNVPPTASITAPTQDTTAALGDAVDFRGSADDADGTVTSHEWDFGDGSGASVEDPGAHAYLARGTYAATYQVTDDAGATSPPDTVLVSVSQAPVSSIDNPGQDTTVTLGDPVDFQGSASNGDDSVVTHVWDFGDGTAAGVEDPGSHTYAAGGTYTVTYQVTDEVGLSSHPDSITVSVNQAPTATIDNPGQDTTAIFPYALDFRGTATDADGEIVSHHWDFGDGNEADVEDPGLYAYTAVGTYPVTYQVTDEDGAVSEAAELVVTVEESAGVAPRPGTWMGGGDSILVGFDVNRFGTAITEVGFTFDDWHCGGATRNERLVSDNPDGWPITDGTFNIETSFAPYELTMTLTGTFRSQTYASGVWTAVSYGTTCSDTWGGNPVFPWIAVFANPDFSNRRILGFHWVPGWEVTLEIDNDADGSIDFTGTTRATSDGTARFHEGDAIPYTVSEGDSIGMHDATMTTGYVLLYVTVDSVDVASDVVSGSAREGTAVSAQPTDPDFTIEVPGVRADANGRWSIDLSGLYDIVSGTELQIGAGCPGVIGGLVCGGYTTMTYVVP